MKSKKKKSISTSISVLAKGTILKGDITTETNIRIDGKLFGKLKGKTKLVVGVDAYIEGDVLAETIEIFGEIKGIIKAEEIIIAHSSSVINGNILSKQISVDTGSIINGKLEIVNNK